MSNDEPRAAPVNPSNPALPLKPGESPAAQSIEEIGWQIMICLAAGNPEAARRALKAFGDRRGEEERAKAWADAAEWLRVTSLTETGYGDLGDYAEHLAEGLRSLAAAPSGDAKGTK